MSRPRQTSNRPGVHFLQSSAVADRLVRAAGVDEHTLVLDLGAGRGAVTAPLARTGARVLAVERDPAFVEHLRSRFGGDQQVRIVHADARTVRLPGRPFTVVASIPFAISTPLLRRLLSPPDSRLTGAELIVEWGLAKRLTEPLPRSPEIALWSVGYELTLRRRIPAACFRPAPDVDAAHLTVRRRNGLSRDVRRVAGQLLRDAYAAPLRPARTSVADLVGRRRAWRLLTTSGIDPPTPGGAVTVDQWLAVADALATDERRRPSVSR